MTRMTAREIRRNGEKFCPSPGRDTRYAKADMPPKTVRAEKVRMTFCIIAELYLSTEFNTYFFSKFYKNDASRLLACGDLLISLVHRIE